MPTEIKAQNTTTLASVKAIYDAADQANTLLDGMQTAAIAAGTTLDGIYQDAADAQTAADDAQASADNASEYAARALGNLSTVQNITETLNWITAHGTMTLTSDVALDPTHVYFVVDPAGDYVVGGTHYSVVTEPDVADISTYYELSINESLNNYVATHLAVDSEGLWIIPDAGGNKVLIAVGGAGHTYTTAGTYIVGKVGGVDTVLAEFTASGAQIGLSSAGNVVVDNDSVDIKDGSTVVATFGIDGSQIGQNGQSRIIEDAYSMQMIDKGQHNYLKIKDLRGESGVYEFQESFRSDGVTTYYGLSLNAIEEEGVYQINVTFTPSSYQYSGTITRYQQGIEFDPPVPDGYYIHARYKTDSDYCKEYTLGSRRVYGGGSSDQVGPMSTVIGFFNSAEAFASYGEGYDTHSRGNCSHAEGWETYASGDYSHSQNMHTCANGEAQTAIGKWNISDYNNEYALIVGNGSQGTPSNALTVDWSGNVEAAGDVTDGSSNTLSSVATTLSSIAAHAVISTGSSNGWNYKKYADGTFEATRFSTNGSTGAMTQVGSSGIYYSSAAEITFPSIGITGITSCLASVMPSSNYLMSYYMSRLTTAHVYFSYIRYGSGSAVTGISYGISITGTYS